MHGNNGEHFTKLVVTRVKRKIEKYIYCWIWPRGDVSLLILRRNHHNKIHKLQKPNILGLWVTDLRNPVSTFRNIYVNETDHVTKSDLNCELKMALTIMAWFSRGTPLCVGQSRCQWNILNTPIKTWIANLSIGDEDNCCQRISLDHSVSIGPGYLLWNPARDFKRYWI